MVYLVAIIVVAILFGIGAAQRLTLWAVGLFVAFWAFILIAGAFHEWSENRPSRTAEIPAYSAPYTPPVTQSTPVATPAPVLWQDSINTAINAESAAKVEAAKIEAAEAERVAAEQAAIAMAKANSIVDFFNANKTLLDRFHGQGRICKMDLDYGFLELGASIGVRVGDSCRILLKSRKEIVSRLDASAAMNVSDKEIRNAAPHSYKKLVEAEGFYQHLLVWLDARKKPAVKQLAVKQYDTKSVKKKVVKPVTFKKPAPLIWEH